VTTQQEFLLLLLLLNRLESVFFLRGFLFSRRAGDGVSRLHNSSFCWTKRNQQQNRERNEKKWTEII
jgi:hypothetical protein